MKERQRWTSEEDALLRAYVKLYGPREWHLVSARMSSPLNRDPKSCLERWKNYLSPNIKKGSLTDEEKRLVISLQSKHGNKWKKIAAEVPGRTAKRLGKWWEVFKEKQRKQEKGEIVNIEPRNYDSLLESFAEKLIPEFLMAKQPSFPSWGNASPSVTLTLSPAVGSTPAAELAVMCREMEEGRRILADHKKEAEWRLRRVELQLEAEKASKRREKMEETEAKMRALREEEMLAMERIDATYREQIAALRRDAEAKEQKLAEQWAAKHARLSKFIEEMGCYQWPSRGEQ